MVMQVRVSRIVEYLYYLAIFLIYFKVSASASVDLRNSSASFVDAFTATNTERSFKNAASSGGGGDHNGHKFQRAFEECENSFSWMCIKLKFVTMLEHLTARDEFRLSNDISVIKDPKAEEIKASDLMAKVARSYPNDPDARLNGYIFKKVSNLLQTHYLRFKLIDDQTIEEARSLAENGRKIGKKGGLEVIMAAGLMMKGVLVAMGMGVIALIAGKALMTALMALTMASLVGLKGLSGSGGKSHVYEIVTKPIYTSSHSHSVSNDDGGHYGHSSSGYGGYARTLDLNLPQSLKGNIKVN